MFFPLSTIKKFHVEIVFVAWLRDLSWEVKIVYLFFFFFKKTLLENFNPSVILFSCFLTANIICICFSFRRLSWPFLRARARQFIYSTLSSSFEWCRAQVFRSGSKDICALQPSNGSRTRTCNGKCPTYINTVGAPGEFYPLASIDKRQLSYFLYMSKLIYPTWKTPWWSLLLSDETRGRWVQVFTFLVRAVMLTSLFRQKRF